MSEKSRLSFNLVSSQLIIQLGDQDHYYKSVITGHIKSYLGLLPNHDLDDNTISLQVTDITQLGSLVENILAILEASSIEVVIDDNIESALLNSQEAEKDFIQFSEEARRIRNAENVLDEIPDFLNVVKTNMTRQPFKKQLLASFHIAFARNVANFSVPGTGKTTMVYTAYAAMQSADYYNEPLKTLLVIGPLSCFIPWQEEYEQCFGRKPSLVVVESVNDIDKLHSNSGPVELILINYEKMRPGSQFQNGLVAYSRIHKTMLVLDEAHRVKNPEGVYANSIMPLARTARSRVVLTGTPIPQGFQDLLNITRFLYPDKKILSYSYKRLKQFTKNPERYVREIGRLTNQFEPFFIRLGKSDFNIKPAVDLTPIHVEFTDTEQRIWNTIDAQSKESNSRFSMIRLLQASSNPYLLSQKLNLQEFYGLEDEDSEEFQLENQTAEQVDLELLDPIITGESENVGSKIKACANLAAKLVGQGEKVIIWIVFTDTAKRVHKALNDLNIQSGALLGKSNNTALTINQNQSRDDVIQSFKNTTQLNCVIANAAAVGESISLHKNAQGEKVCSNALYLERNFNCAQYLQSRDRIHRVGIKDDVQVNYRFFNTPGTLDEHLDQSLKRKSKIMEEFIESESIPLILLEDSDVMKEVYDSYYGTS
jgi:SNF2 family DNA or RNA helicase